MNALLVIGMVFVLALLVHGLLVLAHANTNAYNVQNRLAKYAKRQGAP